MRSLKTALIPVSLIAALLLGVWWWKSGRSEHPAAPSSGGARPSQTPVTVSPAESPLLSNFGRLQEQPERAATLQTLKDLQTKLQTMQRDEAVAWIRSFLTSGKDKPTGLSFEIAADGSLGEWPTFRTFLLDALSLIDPAAAAETSREILAIPTTADEWALALRNVGRAETADETDAYLRAKTEELIANPAWQANPSIGYLNAFDVLVHTNATKSTPLLSSLIQRKDRKDLAHAAFLTLDRLVQRQPVDMLASLATDLPLQQSRPEMTAQQFARADLRDPAQRKIVKSWLLDPARTVTELGSFAGVYPNNNKFISCNLLTRESQQSGADLSADDREALEILVSWANDSAFQSVKPQLLSMIARLEGFLGAPQAPPSPEE